MTDDTDLRQICILPGSVGKCRGLQVGCAPADVDRTGKEDCGVLLERQRRQEGHDGGVVRAVLYQSAAGTMASWKLMSSQTNCTLLIR